MLSHCLSNLRNRNISSCKFNLKDNMWFSDLVEEYFRLYAPNNLKPITAYNYQKHIDYHFMEYFGNKNLKDITTAVISHFFATHKTEIKGEMRTLFPANAKRIYCILQSLFKFAVTQGCIKEAPANQCLQGLRVFWLLSLWKYFDNLKKP